MVRHSPRSSRPRPDLTAYESLAVRLLKQAPRIDRFFLEKPRRFRRDSPLHVELLMHDWKRRSDDSPGDVARNERCRACAARESDAVAVRFATGVARDRTHPRDVAAL